MIRLKTPLKQNQIMKEPITDLRPRMQDNLIFSGVPETTSDNPKTKTKDLIKTNMPQQAWPHPPSFNTHAPIRKGYGERLVR